MKYQGVLIFILALGGSHKAFRILTSPFLGGVVFDIVGQRVVGTLF